MPTTQERFRALSAAFNARDIGTVLAELDPGVDWPNGMEGGRLYGRAAVRAYWTRQWAVIDLRVEPVRVTEDGPERVIVDVHQVVRDLTGAVVADQWVQHAYRMCDGRVQHMEILPLSA